MKILATKGLRKSSDFAPIYGSTSKTAEDTDKLYTSLSGHDLAT